MRTDRINAPHFATVAPVLKAVTFPRSNCFESF